MIIRKGQATVDRGTKEEPRKMRTRTAPASRCTLRGGRVDPVRRPRPDPAAWLALLRPALARRGRRAPLRAFGRGYCHRGGRPPHAPPRRRGLLARRCGERPPGREPFGGALHLPH